MPENRPAKSGYARLAQAEEEEEELFDDSDRFVDTGAKYGTLSSTDRSYAPIQPERRNQRMAADQHSQTGSENDDDLFPNHHRRHSGVDIKAINARLERWAEEIASKFKRRIHLGVGENGDKLEIQYSVFQAPDWIKPVTAEELTIDCTNDMELRMSREEFEDTVESVRMAIEIGVHPKLISQGSSGSYFARNSNGKTVGVFKPKDEEPYASRNPKWTKWIHRNLFPFFFGRACLIPNLSYVSEAAAYVLDVQLRTNLVPYTDVVGLSSKSFFYDFWDRQTMRRKKKPLPEKPGSFQAFLTGYKDATTYLKEHPWPDQGSSSDTTTMAANKRRKRGWTDDCRPNGPGSDDEEHEETSDNTSFPTRNGRQTFWTEALQQGFREQLEKLVILDYIMRNTDRGLDNWMIRIDEQKQQVSLTVDPCQSLEETSGAPATAAHGEQYRPYGEQMTIASTGSAVNATQDVRQVRIGAIDNSLSWPWKHPDAWRSYPFGWLFLPVSLIGQPFSAATRRHFLPMLTSKAWWAETQLELRKCFMRDADFQEKMYAKQIAVMKGQAWNVVETLKTDDHGPLELTRRARVYVWDDLVDVPVAVPLRSPARSMRRPGRSHDKPEPELISTNDAQGPIQHQSRFHEDEQATGHFNIPRQSCGRDIQPSFDSTGVTAKNPLENNGEASSDCFTQRPLNKSCVSYDDPRQSASARSWKRSQRKFSLTFRSGSNPLGDDGDEGDLGFAAAEDMEDSRKKVIVERLEPVKSSTPFFTWC